MSKNAKKSIEEYSKKTQREAERIIRIKEDNKGRKLTEQEKRNIAKKVSARRKKENFIRSFLVLGGIIVGGYGVNKYTEIINKGMDKENKSITIDTSISGINEIKVKNKRNQAVDFKNELKVTVDGKRLEIIEDIQEKNVKEATIEEVNNLKTKEQVLDYIKEIYCEEYNKINDDKVGKDDISFYRDKYMVRLDEDVAKNGDKILRVAEGHKGNKNRYGFPIGIITVQVNTDKGIITEEMVEKDGKYFTVYGMDEKVKKYEQNIAAKIGGILNYGMCVVYSKDENSTIINKNEEEYQEMVSNCEAELVNEVCKRKINYIDELQGIKDDKTTDER